MSQLERGQPLVPVARNMPVPIPTSTTGARLQPQPVIPRPPVVSEGQKQATAIIKAIGMTAGVVGTIGDIAAQRRAMTKADQRELDAYDIGAAARLRERDYAR